MGASITGNAARGGSEAIGSRIFTDNGGTTGAFVLNNLNVGGNSAASSNGGWWRPCDGHLIPPATQDVRDGPLNPGLAALRACTLGTALATRKHRKKRGADHVHPCDCWSRRLEARRRCARPRRGLALAVADGVDLDETPVRDYVSPNVIEVDQEAPAAHAARQMKVNGVRHVVVVAAGEPSRMISAQDLDHRHGPTSSAYYGGDRESSMRRSLLSGMMMLRLAAAGSVGRRKYLWSARNRNLRLPYENR